MPVTVTEITHDEGTTIGVDRSQRVRRFQVKGFATGSPENAIASMVSSRPDLALNEPHPAPWTFMTVYDHAVSEVIHVEDESGASKLPTEAIVDVRYIDSTSTYGGGLTSLNAVTFSERAVERVPLFWQRTVETDVDPRIVYDERVFERPYVKYLRRERLQFASEASAYNALNVLLPYLGFAYTRPDGVVPNPDNAIWVYSGSSVVRGSGNEVFLTHDFVFETPRYGHNFAADQIIGPGDAYDPGYVVPGNEGYLNIPYTPSLARLDAHWTAPSGIPFPEYHTTVAGHPYGGSWPPVPL